MKGVLKRYMIVNVQEKVHTHWFACVNRSLAIFHLSIQEDMLFTVSIVYITGRAPWNFTCHMSAP